MILIISRDSEPTTDLVIDWLYQLNVPFIRINDELSHDVYNDFQTGVLKVKGIDISAITVVWFRKYASTLDWDVRNFLEKNLSKSFNSFYDDEALSFREYFFNELRKNKNIQWLTKPFKSTENKLIQMKVAKEYGLRIPETYVMTSKKDLFELIKQNNNTDFITKPFKNCRHVALKGKKSVLMKTTVVNPHIENLPDFSSSINTKENRQKV